MNPIEKLKVNDIKLICEMPRHKSMRSLAQDFNQTPQNMSKIIKSIESHLGQTLLKRSSSGYSPTSFCLSLADQLGSFLNQIYEIDFSEKSKAHKSKSYVICARVFMNTCLAPALSTELSAMFPELKLKFVDASPKKKMEWARQNILDIVISVGEIDLPKDWLSHKVGSMQRSFYVRSNHPLGRSCHLEDLVNYPYVGFNYVDVNHVSSVGFPRHLKSKNSFNQSFIETHIGAMTIASKSQQVCFIPDILVQSLGYDIKLQKLEVIGTKPVSEEVYLYVHKDRVNHLHHKKITSILEAELS